jgi:hypothetical protein
MKTKSIHINISFNKNQILIKVTTDYDLLFFLTSAYITKRITTKIVREFNNEKFERDEN